MFLINHTSKNINVDSVNFVEYYFYSAEPMKKKKRVDPNILAARTQKKLKRIDKEIKRLTKFGRIMKPVTEIEGERRKLMAQVYVCLS